MQESERYCRKVEIRAGESARQMQEKVKDTAGKCKTEQANAGKFKTCRKVKDAAGNCRTEQANARQCKTVQETEGYCRKVQNRAGQFKPVQESQG